MTEERAKEILLLYRPDSPDATDPDVAEALALAKDSPALGRWFENQCAVQEALRSKFREAHVPEGLKEQIISEYKAQTAAARLQRRVMVAAAAVLLVVGIAAGIWLSQPNYGDYERFPAYLNRMVGTVLRQYAMDLETNDVARIRTFLSSNHAPADWNLTPPLKQTELAGCGVLQWQGNPVSMICFRSGKPLPPGQTSDLFLFVIERKDLKEPPPEGTPQIASVNKLLTASWSTETKTYVLATDGDEAFLRSLL